jgi:hypothetical protein
MDAHLFTDPIVVGLLGKIAAAAVILLLAIGFVPGIIIGWFVGKAT